MAKKRFKRRRKAARPISSDVFFRDLLKAMIEEEIERLSQPNSLFELLKN